MERVKRLAAEHEVLIISKTSCCLCYAVNVLLRELGVSPLVYELDQDPDARDMEKALVRLQGCHTPAVPAVFIAGDLVGSTNEVMSLHLSGELNRMLKPFKVVQEN
ncbi:glutaredoxin-C13-like [Cucurbita maxima]|uniref:Glutaredoxin-C13-like n=1 Tax=Cucurbita maxima TaxID=3661 RepID=A0A6J1JY66_CUCMA|nr:glutaredoxin-C13-like [Cucurbita maxima]